MKPVNTLIFWGQRYCSCKYNSMADYKYNLMGGRHEKPHMPINSIKETLKNCFFFLIFSWRWLFFYIILFLSHKIPSHRYFFSFRIHWVSTFYFFFFRNELNLFFLFSFSLHIQFIFSFIAYRLSFSIEGKNKKTEIWKKKKNYQRPKRQRK